MPSFRVDMVPEPRAVKLLTALAEVCDRTQDPGTVRCALNELSWSLLDCTLRAAPRRARRSCDPRRWLTGTAPRWEPITAGSSRPSRITPPA
jgi:hypothetical protein